MKYSDYKCPNCGNIRQISIKTGSNPFPENIPCYVCEGQSQRIYTAIPAIVFKGKCGNSKNGYVSSETNIKKS